MTAVTTRSAGAASAAALALAWAALAPAAPAFAHNSVIAEGPKADSTISAQPGDVWIETNDVLLDLEGATAMDVVGPDGRHYATACPAVEGAVASASAELGPAGEYTVAWRVVSADGHPITGDFAFEWQPADGEPVAEGAAEPVCGATSESSDADGGGAGSDEATDAAASVGDDLVWIAVAVVAMLGAGVVAFAIARRRPAPPTATDGPAPDPGETGADPRHDG